MVFRKNWGHGEHLGKPRPQGAPGSSSEPQGAPESLGELTFGHNTADEELPTARLTQPMFTSMYLKGLAAMVPPTCRTASSAGRPIF